MVGEGRLCRDIEVFYGSPRMEVRSALSKPFSKAPAFDELSAYGPFHCTLSHCKVKRRPSIDPRHEAFEGEEASALSTDRARDGDGFQPTAWPHI